VGLWTFHNGSGLLRNALALAERFLAIATNGPDPRDPLVGERMISVSQQFLGDLLGARITSRMCFGERSPSHAAMSPRGCHC
jgi:hypothetical protein